MNSYYVTKCPHCGRADGHEPHEEIMTHGADNLNKVIKMLEEGMDFNEVKKLVCKRCGGFKETPDYCSCQDTK